MKAERVDLGDVKGEKGEKGEKGVGIREIYKTETEGYNNTYRIVLTDDTYYEIIVKDGTNVTTLDHIDSASTHPVRSSTLYTELGKKINQSEKGASNGVATLDSNRKIPNNQLPSYVDDVIEGYYHNNQFYEEDTHETLVNAEGGKIYIDIPTGNCYRWGGSTYAKITENLTIGTTSGTAFSGERGLTVENKVNVLEQAVASIPPRNVFFGQCSTPSTTQTKTVTCSDWTIKEGNIIYVFFINSNTYEGNINLNINNTGNIAVQNSYDGASWGSLEVVGFVCTSNNAYYMIENGKASTSIYGVTKLQNTLDTSTDKAVTPNAVKTKIDELNSLIEDINDYINQ